MAKNLRISVTIAILLAAEGVHLAMTSTVSNYRYTYTLGRSLYVPLTAWCNSKTLPETRGPGFTLPASVASALLRVRGNGDGEPSSPLQSPGFDEEINDDGRVCLAPSEFPRVCMLYGDGYESRRRQHVSRAEDINGRDIPPPLSFNHDYDEDFLHPPITSLVDEVASRLRSDGTDTDPSSPSRTYDQVVIAGEGEPTLRMPALLAVVRSLRPSRGRSSDRGSIENENGQAIGSGGAVDGDAALPVRVITNALCFGIRGSGYDGLTASRQKQNRFRILSDMAEAGVTEVSVALNTANRHQYDVLMEPCLASRGTGDGVEVDDESARGTPGSRENDGVLVPGAAHDLVCEFIIEARRVGLEVEVTGVDMPDVDKKEMERLARFLLGTNGKPSKVRWRPYFP